MRLRCGQLGGEPENVRGVFGSRLLVGVLDAEIPKARRATGGDHGLKGVLDPHGVISNVTVKHVAPPKNGIPVEW